MSVEILRTASFDQFIAGTDKPVFIDFSAVWCGPCRFYGPLFHEFADENADAVQCGTVDIDENRELAMRFGIQAVPTTLIFKGGQIVDSIMGAVDKRTLEVKLRNNA